MNRKTFIIPTTILILFFFSSFSLSQIVGTIYSQGDANKLFGGVLETVTMNQSEFQTILSQTQNYVMIKISKDGLTILGDKRKVLYPEGKSVDPNEVFYIFSKLKVTELLKQSASDKIIFEAREKTQTITSGILTLEDALMCPPFCP